MHQVATAVLALALAAGALGCGRIGPGTGRLDPRRGQSFVRPEPVEQVPVYAQRPCPESIQARADGLAGEDDPGGKRYYTYYASCQESCAAGEGAPACVEAALLVYTFNPSLGGIPELVAYCGLGDAQSCAWVETHQEEIAQNDQRLADEAAQADYQRRLDEAIAREQAKVDAWKAEEAAREANTPVALAAAALISTEESEGYRLSIDRSVTLSSTGNSFEMPTVSFNDYLICVIADRGTAMTGYTKQAIDEDDGEYVHTTTETAALSQIDLGGDVSAIGGNWVDREFESPWIHVDSAGGSTVRLLVFERRK